MLNFQCIKKFFFIIVIILINFQNLFPQVIFPGEDLKYEVSFYGIKLGTIRVITIGEENISGKKVYKTISYMDTYKGIPFVDLHNVYESWLDPSITFSHKFFGTMKSSNSNETQLLLFDYINGNILNEKKKNKELIFRENIPITQKYNDGLSLFFLARKFLNSNKSFKIPTIIDKDTTYTIINFLGKKEKIEISAVKYPIKTVALEGKAEWKGVYGLNGKFQGWFSDDDARIPILAKMNVYVGDVRIELVEWKRTNWTPPKAN